MAAQGSFKFISVENDPNHFSNVLFMTLKKRDGVKLVTLNFEGMFEHECGPMELGDTSDWESFELNNSECVNGSKTRLLRRKKDHLCSITSSQATSEKKFQHVNCECAY